jgi:O-antigen/teichoic acid export membrane protein
MGLASPVLTLYTPKLAEATRRDARAQAAYAERTVPMLAVFWLLALAPCIALMPWVFRAIFGAPFEPALPAFLVLCIAVPGAILSYPYSALFNVQGRTARAAQIVAAMTIVNIGLSLVLVPPLGGVGAAAGTAASYLLYQLLYMIDQHRHLGVAVRVPFTLFVVATAFGLAQWAASDGPLARAVAAAACMAAVVVVSRRFRLVQPGLVAGMLPPPLRPLARWAERILARA